MAEHAVSLATQSVALPPRYECLLEVEQGGGGRCQLAIDSGADRALATRRLVAVHRVPPAVEEDVELRAQFAARAAAFLPLRHPNLVSTFEAVSERQPCHWVSEFVPGAPLPRLLTKTKGGRRALSTRKILAILCDVARALEYTHVAVDAAGLPRPVVHGNLCPASVLVTYDGIVKVSGEIGRGALGDAVDSSDAALAHLACLAPECGRAGRGDTRCDVYALGAILWEALAGHSRSHGLTPDRAVALRLRGEEPDLGDVCPDVLPALAAVTRRALSIDPCDRHPSVGALREELERIAQLDVFKNETTPLFGFMCNHFCEEYAALQALLEGHSMLHALFAPRPLLEASVRSLSPASTRAMSVGENPSLRESGLRRVPGASVLPPTIAPLGISRVMPTLPLANHQPPTVALPLAGSFGRTKTSAVVLVVVAGLAALGRAGSGTRAAGPFDHGEPALVVPSIDSQLGDSVPADPASVAPPRAPSALGSGVNVEALEATTASAARRVPERGSTKPPRPVRGNSRARATRGDSPVQHAVGTAPRTPATRRAPPAPQEDSTDRAGVDLRLLNERPQRAIDKQDPYLP